MGLFQSLTVGVSGLTVQTNVIGAISDNIANINTTGYKKTSTLFHDLIAADNSAFYSPGGASGTPKSLIRNQGAIYVTNSATDIGIFGNGFLPVRTSPTAPDVLYTRAGSFLPNQDGDFVNGAGFFLQGILLENQELPAGFTDDEISSSVALAGLETVNIGALADSFVATTTVDILSNLKASQDIYVGLPAYDPTDIAANMADGGVPPAFSRSFTVVDSEGVGHSVIAGFVKSGLNVWEVELYVNDPDEIGAASAQIAYGTLTFNGDGTLNSVSGSIASAVNISWQNIDPDTLAVTTTTNNFTVNWGTAGAIGDGEADGIQQYDQRFTLRVNQNGFESGSLVNVTFTEDGYVVGNYNNGIARRLYKLFLANFVEPNELVSMTGNVYDWTDNVGTITFSGPNQGASGKMAVSALESSNVEMETQMADLIIAQRAYQANSKVLSFSNDMLERLDRMLG